MAFYAGGSAAPLRELLTSDVVWRVPGQNAIAGVYTGIDAVMAYFARRREMARGTFRMHPGEVLVGEGEHAAVLTDGTALLHGAEQSWSTLGLYRFRDNRVAACWLLPPNAREFDRIWGEILPPPQETPTTTRSSTSEGLLGRIVASISQFANKHGLYLGRRSTRIHVALYRRTGGKLGGHLPGWPSARILLLDHTGAKSGTRRTSPLMYHEDGDVVAVVASKGGQPTHPAWFHNVKANPDTTIQVGSALRDVRARVSTDAERDWLWPKFVAFYPGYDFLQRNAKDRRIPIVILDPR